MSNCQTCGRLLDDPKNPTATRNCGGDCLECMAGFDDPDCLREMCKRLRVLLAHAVAEADGWCDEAQGGPIKGDALIDEAREMTKGVK